MDSVCSTHRKAPPTAHSIAQSFYLERKPVALKPSRLVITQIDRSQFTSRLASVQNSIRSRDGSNSSQESDSVRERRSMLE